MENFFKTKILVAALLSLCLYFNGSISRWTWVSRYQNVSILDFIGAKDDGGGGDNWSCKSCKAPVKSSPPTNQHPVFYRPDALPVAQPTVSKYRREVGALLWQVMFETLLVTNLSFLGMLD